MYIQPNSIIVLCNNVPLSPSYTDTIYFNNIQEQYEYFHSKRQLTFSSQTYQRRGRNYIRLQVAPSQMKWAMSCNYLYFNNTSYEDKWFYAFITSTEYINDNTVEVGYIADELQTWLFEMDLGECFIERQHSTTDEIGDNLIAEPVEIGEYLYKDYTKIFFSNGEYNFYDKTIMVLSARTTDVVNSNSHGGIYGGGTLHAFRFDGITTTDVDNLVSQYLEDPENIVSIYMCPSNFIANINITENNLVASSARTPIAIDTCGSVVGNESFGISGNPSERYTPKNKKLYTYPYNFCVVNNGGSGTLALRYEFGGVNARGEHVLQLELNGTFAQPVSAIVRPYNYKGVGSTSKIHTESLSLDGFPVCSWNVDAYKAWVAQNAIPMGINAITSLGGVMSKTPVTSTTRTLEPVLTPTGRQKMSGGNPVYRQTGSVTETSTSVQAINGGQILSMVGNAMSQAYTASIGADIMRGCANNGNVNYSNNDMGFYSARCSVDYQHALNIDKFFTMFGYAQNKVGVPNINARESFTYVKTIGCELHGNMPSEANEVICNIFDSGVRWWNDPELVGNYNVSNEPRY